MARVFLALCITTLIASTYVSAFHIQPAKHMSFPLELLDVFAMQNSINTNSMHGIQELDVLYQDSMGQGPSKKIPDLENAELSPKVSNSCESSTYCEEVLNYPQDAVDKVISKLEKLKFLGFKQIDSLDQPTFAQRSNFENKELCEAPETLVAVKSGVDMDGKNHFLLNGVNNTFQRFRVQKCKETGCKCDKVISGFESGFRGRCHQFYFYRPATAFTTNATGDILKIYFPTILLPSHCACIAEPCTNITSESGPDKPMCDSQLSEV